ncbi:MAG TPA: thermonuclease family protein [Thermoleophilaceae bacterium]
MKPRMLIAALLAAIAAVGVLAWPSGTRHSTPGAGRGISATVIRPVDGDTLVARAGGRTFYVRLLGIDTPETHRPGTPVECGGPQASTNMARLAPPGAHVRLETDPGQDRVDRYGRLLAYVWLVDGRLLETAQLESGWANTYVYAGRPVELFPRLLSAWHDARAGHRGVWSACGGDFHSASN